MKLKFLLPTILIVVIAAAFAWLFWDSILNIEFVPQVVHTELGFNNYADDYALMIRQESPESKNLLMKVSGGNGVYLYESASRNFSYKDDKIWDNARGEIKVCDKQIIAPVRSSSQTYGKYLLNFKPDSTLTKQAIITTNGFKIPPIGILPNLGGTGRITGVRYFEVLSSNGEKIGKSYRIQKLEMDSSPYLCWSKDNDFVVVSDTGYSTLAVFDIADLESK